MDTLLKLLSTEQIKALTPEQLMHILKITTETNYLSDNSNQINNYEVNNTTIDDIKFIENELTNSLKVGYGRHNLPKYTLADIGESNEQYSKDKINKIKIFVHN